MFSGIVETTSQITATTGREGVVQCSLLRPTTFDDIKIGDSIAVDGVCLTVEKFDAEQMIFALGPETLRVTGWEKSLKGRTVNLERSLRLSDRIHGHLVTGHVDALGQVQSLDPWGESLAITIAIPKDLAPYIWPKGSIAINGVSLTINQANAEQFQVGLIPETLKRTNLGRLKVGDQVNLEIDNTARGIVHNLSKEMK